jgi:RNA polymerase sigma factor (sigma-70 family)
MDPLPPDVQDSDDEAEDSWLVQIEPTLAKLPEHYRQVLQQTFYEEKSSKEIGDGMGLSEGAVRVLRHRALNKLGKLLEKSDDHQ